MLIHSQRNIQNQIDSLIQQTTTAKWYNTQLATELPSGRPNSVVRTIATTPGLPLELEMTAEQAEYVHTILHAKNILPTIGASSSNQLFNVSHPPKNLEIHPPNPPKSQISTFQQTQVLAMPVPGEQLSTPILFLQLTDGIFISKPLPGHTYRYPHVLFVVIPGMIGTNALILRLDSTHHAY